MRTVAIVLAAVAVTAVRADDKKDAPAKPIEVTGRLEGAVVEVRPRVTGYLESVKVKDGDTVKKGDLLAEIDPRPYKAELDKARAEVKVAEAKIKVAQGNRDRLKVLAEKGVVSKEEFEQVAAELDVAKATSEANRAVLAVAEINLAYTKLTAAIDGRVRFLVTEGNLVRADETLLGRIVGSDPLTLTFEVSEETFFKLWQGKVIGPKASDGKLKVSFGLTPNDNYPYSAALSSTDPSVDPKTGMIQCRATVPNSNGKFYPGLFTRVKLSPAK